MPARPEDLFARLDALGIETRTHDHPPLFTVEDSKRLRGDLPGGHCKNLFLKDKRGDLFLAVVLEDRRIDLKRLSRRIGARNLSFARSELLEEVLGLTPGGVTPFAAINDAAGRVRILLDRAMLDRAPLNYHPLTNDRTTAIAPGDLVRFLEATGHRPEIVDFDAPDWDGDRDEAEGPASAPAG
jgi:Ala-tRNA(Pro) deacylase